VAALQHTCRRCLALLTPKQLASPIRCDGCAWSLLCTLYHGCGAGDTCACIRGRSHHPDDCAQRSQCATSLFSCWQHKQLPRCVGVEPPRTAVSRIVPPTAPSIASAESASCCRARPRGAEPCHPGWRCRQQHQTWTMPLGSASSSQLRFDVDTLGMQDLVGITASTMPG